MEIISNCNNRYLKKNISKITFLTYNNYDHKNFFVIRYKIRQVKAISQNVELHFQSSILYYTVFRTDTEAHSATI